MQEQVTWELLYARACNNGMFYHSGMFYCSLIVSYLCKLKMFALLTNNYNTSGAFGIDEARSVIAEGASTGGSGSNL